MFIHRLGLGWGHAGGGHHLLGLLVLVLVVGLAVAAIVLMLRDRRTVRSDVTANGAPSEASRILDERFARGEIDDDEYRRRRAVLQSGA